MCATEAFSTKFAVHIEDFVGLGIVVQLSKFGGTALAANQVSWVQLPVNVSSSLSSIYTFYNTRTT